MRRHAGPALYRSIAFAVLAVFLGVMVWRLVGGDPTPPTSSYDAVFTDVSALRAGDPVKVAGVVVGSVEKVTVDAARKVGTVKFGVEKTLQLTDRTRAVIRYANLTGDRYLALSDGIAPATRAAQGTDLQQTAATTPARGLPLVPGEEIPLARTAPALDLDALFGGFQPLFEALTPEQVNRLSADFVRVLQGEGGTVVALLRDVADFTVTLADRTALIGQVITNLNSVLGTLTENTPEFVRALDAAQKLVSGLNQQRVQLSQGLVATAKLSDQLTDTLRQARPDLVSTSGQLERLSALLTTDRNAKSITDKLTYLPKGYRAMAGAGSYGAWTNLYLCGLSLQLDGVQGKMTTLDEPRCK